jgi:16S rRNA (guanine966-N2)-methyltransferase
MLDRVREALFSTLGDVVEGANVLDLFAGTGSLGLEALSRGAQHVRFVERDAVGLRLLRRNVQLLGVARLVRTVRADAFEAASWGDGPYELVLVDPPYPRLEGDARARVFGAVARLIEGVLARGGVLVLHTPPRAASRVDFPTGVELDERRYGRTVLWYVWKPVEAVSEEAP